MSSKNAPRKKQQTLMSFFKPANLPSSPTKPNESDKENEPSLPTPVSSSPAKNAKPLQSRNVYDSDEDDVIVRPKRRRERSEGPEGSEVKRIKSTPSQKPSSVSKPTPSSQPTPSVFSFNKQNEERYQWLVDVRDGQNRDPSHPQYDPRTLYIPQSAWSKFTAFEKQYWEIKSQMWNTVVFFKKGKFYELYENDALIANREFDLKIAGGGRANMKLAGIPEMSFEYWAKEFISHGYKIAKVDQKESLLMKEMRGGGSKEEKIIKRELVAVLTAGTLTDLDMISDDMPTYCMSVREAEADGSKHFGAAFVDTSTGEINLVEFDDDMECTKLDTLVAQTRPREVVVAKNNLCATASRILRAEDTIWNAVNDGDEFWDKETTKERVEQFPSFPVLKKFEKSWSVGFHAFGGLLSYLESLKLDNIMTLGNIVAYDVSKSTARHMLLDGITLHNLELVANTFDGSDKGTLFKLLNRATTAFGRRAMKKWLLYPLVAIKDIEQRYDAVDFLMGPGLEVRARLETAMRSLPDLERLLARVHAKTLRFRDFLRLVEAFESVAEMGQITVPQSAGSLHTFLRAFPTDIVDHIKVWEDAFDRAEAKNDVVVPIGGFDEEFNESKQMLDALEKELAGLLRTYKKSYGSETVYRDSGKEIYLIELPVRAQVPADWQQMGATSKVRRYWSPEVKQLARSLTEQRELHKHVCESLKSRMYAKFDAQYPLWASAVRSVAAIDCLLSLARASEAMGVACRPSLTEQPGLYFEELRNPVFAGRDFIPNTVALGGPHASFNLLTGANAAGKSTLMRTTALATILCQVGCYVPAAKASLAPVDRIMTRLGANDNIMQGKSTFYVELSETKKLLANASPRSLVILDELGRGGSSSDGYAIAEAVLYHLATHIQPLGFFATHYNTLGSSFVGHPQIAPRRMAIVLDEDSRNITFLYRLEEGVAPGSFGMNVASMCGIADEIVDSAEIAAKKHESTMRFKKSEEVSLGVQSDVAWMLGGGKGGEKALVCLFEMIGHIDTNPHGVRVSIEHK